MRHQDLRILLISVLCCSQISYSMQDEKILQDEKFQQEKKEMSNYPIESLRVFATYLNGCMLTDGPDAKGLLEVIIKKRPKEKIEFTLHVMIEPKDRSKHTPENPVRRIIGKSFIYKDLPIAQALELLSAAKSTSSDTKK